MTQLERTFEIARLQQDKRFWLRELELCPKGDPLLREYVLRSLELVQQDLAEVTDA